MPPCRIEWLDEAKTDVRRLDRAIAMRLFDGILHYARSGGGHVAPLHGSKRPSLQSHTKQGTSGYFDHTAFAAWEVSEKRMLIEMLV